MQHSGAASTGVTNSAVNRGHWKCSMAMPCQRSIFKASGQSLQVQAWLCPVLCSMSRAGGGALTAEEEASGYSLPTP